MAVCVKEMNKNRHKTKVPKRKKILTQIRHPDRLSDTKRGKREKAVVSRAGSYQNPESNEVFRPPKLKRNSSY
jgi:hypothetical protein